MKMIWVILGHFFLMIGFVGAFVPLLPTTPFLLLTFFCYSRGSEKFQKKLLAHPWLGPPIKDWLDHGVIRFQAKIMSILICLCSFFMLWFVFAIPQLARLCATLILVSVCFFIYSRPSKF
ncbi:MAG: YbaN family protein [Oligoflexales bacterium]